MVDVVLFASMMIKGPQPAFPRLGPSYSIRVTPCVLDAHAAASPH